MALIAQSSKGPPPPVAKKPTAPQPPTAKLAIALPGSHTEESSEIAAAGVTLMPPKPRPRPQQALPTEGLLAAAEDAVRQANTAVQALGRVGPVAAPRKPTLNREDTGQGHG